MKRFCCFFMRIPRYGKSIMVYSAIQFIFSLLCLIIQAHSYVLLQVRRDNLNRSNVDALIHKVVPSEKFDNFARNIARKHFVVGNEAQKQENLQTKPSSESKEKREIEETFKNLVKNKPVFRANNIKIEPEVVHFRSKPSLMYEVNTKTIIQALKDLLSSKTVAYYTDKIAENAATAYRAITSNK